MRFRDSRHSTETRFKIHLVSSMHVAEWNGAAFGFSLTDDVGVTYFSAESDRQKHKWMKSIRLVLSNLRKKTLRTGVGQGKRKKKPLFSWLSKTKKDVAGVVRHGHLLDTAREFLQMDGVVPIIVAEDGKRSELVSGLLNPREIELEGEAPTEEDQKEENGKEKGKEEASGEKNEKTDGNIKTDGNNNNNNNSNNNNNNNNNNNSDDDSEGLREKLHHVNKNKTEKMCFFYHTKKYRERKWCTTLSRKWGFRSTKLPIKQNKKLITWPRRQSDFSRCLLTLVSSPD